MISALLIYVGCTARVHGENVTKLVSHILNSMYCLMHFVMCMTGISPTSLSDFCYNDLPLWMTCLMQIWAHGFLQVICFTQYILSFYGCCMVFCQRLVFDSILKTTMLHNK